MISELSLFFFASLGSFFGLMLVAFLSASIIPFPIEPAMVLALKLLPPEAIFFSVLLGSVVANILNYYIGYYGLHSRFVERDSEKERRAEEWFRKYGNVVMLLYPWVPFFGDFLTLVAGTLKMDFKKFLFWCILSKAIKLAIVLFLGIQLLAWTGW